MKRFLISIWEVLEVVVIAVGAVFLIRNFLVQPFLVVGSSMDPNFYDGDYLLIDELTYRFREPSRGEVAVFHYPNDKSTFFIKRIIGLPGERVKLLDGKVFIFNKNNSSGLIIEEEYLNEGIRTDGSTDVKLSENEYFLLGDNRAYSFDSRRWGPLQKTEIVGLVRIRLWPPKNATVFAAPEYRY